MKAIIELAEDGGFGVYCNEIEMFGYGLTEQEAKEDFIENVKELAEYEKEQNGEYPKWFSESFEYKYDFSAFFVLFPFFNTSEFAKVLGQTKTKSTI